MDDDNIHSVVVAGKGKGFCAGADVNYLHELVSGQKLDEGEALVSGGSQVVEMIHNADKPVIAAINGATAGGGAGIALACDIRLMAQSASIGFTFVRIGLHPDLGCMYFLPRLVGPAKAAELFMTGEMIAADEALRLGMVNQVIPDTELMPRAMLMARALAEKSPHALRLMKKGLAQSLDESLEKILKYEIDSQKECFGSPQAKSALQQFLDSRRKK
jgi:2-(1,2-epoxy-1,2-dihydrophenyl)acetyl-CoA isomerase